MKRLYTLLLIFLSAFPHFTMGETPRLPFRVDTDFSQFRLTEDKNYLAIYYACDESRLTYKEEGEKFEGAILMRVFISHIFEDSAVVDRTFRIPHVVDDTSAIKVGKTFLGLLKLAIPVGDHFLRISSFDDVDRSRNHRVMYEISKKVFDQKSVILSGIDLCSSIKKIARDPNNVFYKNTLEVIPNPTKTFGLGLPTIYYYVEAYNLLAEAEGGTYTIKVAIYDSEDNVVLSQSRSKKRVNDTSVEMGTVNVESLPNGTYLFELSLIDSVTNVMARAVKNLFIHNPGIVVDTGTAPSADDYMASEFGSKTGKELDDYFEILRYIADRIEISKYKRLRLVDEKRKFLFDFWKIRDPTPTNAVNEVKLEFNRRLQYVNINYASGFKKGWKTHRGRVYLMYGEPEELIREEYDANQKSHELWYYHNIQGGVLFVFADLSGFQDYQLIHSTHWDEIQDYDWKRLVQQQF